ncbi:hypothetical protein PANDA_022352 [Ailuropoda melanoleuca]|uniref:N-terminal Ras-GEF domain-containing protein n=1 Tax=Ailuropoda melanoleuca TaxID=9646 RepID=D2I8E9_AILME|nr:hypothetical protein PANDA_022352 [Ailuropoda melanoleuca]
MASTHLVERRHWVLSRAISSILATWLGHYPEDFFQPPEFPCLRALLAYVRRNVPGSDLEQRAELLLSRLRHLEPAELEAVAPEPEQAPAPAMEAPEEPLKPRPMSETVEDILTDLTHCQEPAHDILTALTPCQELEDPPVPFAAPASLHTAALSMEVPEEPLMPPAL